jgi:hypothetical protein
MKPLLDLRYALRSMRHHWRLTLAVTTTFGLGIGAARARERPILPARSSFRSRRQHLNFVAIRALLSQSNPGLRGAIWWAEGTVGASDGPPVPSAALVAA